MKHKVIGSIIFPIKLMSSLEELSALASSTFFSSSSEWSTRSLKLVAKSTTSSVLHPNYMFRLIPISNNTSNLSMYNLILNLEVIFNNTQENTSYETVFKLPLQKGLNLWLSLPSKILSYIDSKAPRLLGSKNGFTAKFTPKKHVCSLQKQLPGLAQNELRYLYDAIPLIKVHSIIPCSAQK